MEYKRKIIEKYLKVVCDILNITFEINEYEKYFLFVINIRYKDYTKSFCISNDDSEESIKLYLRVCCLKLIEEVIDTKYLEVK